MSTIETRVTAVKVLKVFWENRAEITNTAYTLTILMHYWSRGSLF